MAINSFKRKEIKFLLSVKQYKELLGEIDKHMEPDKFCIDGREYGVYNVYYDTEDSFLIRESLAKPYFKEKLRLRSYFSPASSEDTVFLGIKRKIGGIVTKRRVTMTLAEAEHYIATGEKPHSGKYITNQVFGELDIFLQNYDVSPVQYISYQRTAFFGRDNKDFRLTFDRTITQRRCNLTLREESSGAQIIRPDQRLMEIKITDAMPMWLSNKLSELEIYKTSFSKYGKAYQSYVQEKITNERGVYIYA